MPRTGVQRSSKAVGGISDVSVTETGTYLQKSSSSEVSHFWTGKVIWPCVLNVQLHWHLQCL